MSEAAKKAKAALSHTTPAPTPPTATDYLSTGVTPLNLACCGRVFGGLRKGGIYRLIGKSRTGKTFLARNILCEAAINKAFAAYTLIHNDIEVGAHMPNEKFWPPLVPRLRAASYDKEGSPIRPKSLKEFYETTRARLDTGVPFVEVVDSLDILPQENLETKMGDGRAKTNSQEMRKLINDIEKTGSILILVQHAKVNMGSTWSELVTTGGASPEFYSTLDIWLGRCEQIKVTYKGNDLPVGEMIQAHVVKNRTNGVDRKIRFPLYNDYGIDDIGACIWYLTEFGHWTKDDGKISAQEFGPWKKSKEGKPILPRQQKLVEIIETGKKQQELRLLVGKVWKEIATAISQKRECRYK